MMALQRGSVLLFVMLAAAVITVWTTVMIHSARYMVQAATDRLVWEQRLAVAEAVLSYAVAWCQENRSLLVAPQEQENEKDEEGRQGGVQVASSWEIIFERLPLSNKQVCSARVSLSLHEVDSMQMNVALYTECNKLFALRSLLAGFADNQKPLVLSEWTEVSGS